MDIQPRDRLAALITALAHPYTGADQVAMKYEAIDLLEGWIQPARPIRTQALAALMALYADLERDTHLPMTADVPSGTNLDARLAQLGKIIEALR